MSDDIKAKLPLDFQLDYQRLQQRQALANAMMQKALTPATGQMVGPHYVAPSPLASIGAPIAEALMTNYMNSQNNARAAELAKLYKGAQNRMSPKEIMSIPGASLESRRQAALANEGEGDPSLLQPDQREHVVNGQVVTTTPGQPSVVAGDYRDKLSPLRTVGTNPDKTPIQAQVVEGTGEHKYSPSGGVRVNVDTTQKAGDAFATGLAKERATIISKSYDNAIAASKAYDALSEARKDLESGIMSGSAANFSLGLAKVAKVLGMPADPAIVNTEAFRSNMARETLNLVKNLGAGTGISNADRDFAERTAGGDITLDDKTMFRLMNIAAAASGNVLVQHNELLDKNMKATGAVPADLATFEVPMAIRTSREGTPGGLIFDEKVRRFSTADLAPASSAPTAAAPIPLHQYLRQRRGGR